MDTSLLAQSPIMSAEALCLSIARKYEDRVGRGRGDDGRSKSLARTLREYAEVLGGVEQPPSARDLLAAWSLAIHAHGQPSDLGQLGGATGRCLTLAELIMLAGGMPRGNAELELGDYDGGEDVLRTLCAAWSARSADAPGDRRYAVMAETARRELDRAVKILQELAP